MNWNLILRSTYGGTETVFVATPLPPRFVFHNSSLWERIGLGGPQTMEYAQVTDCAWV